MTVNLLTHPLDIDMKIFVTRNIPTVGIDKLTAAGHEVVVSQKDGVLTAEELIEQLTKENPDAVLCLLTDKIDGKIFDAAPNAKIFANYAVGFDNIDLEEAKKREILITNTPDVLTEAVAEHAVALMLSLGRRVVESDRFLRDGKYQGWGPMLLTGMEFKGKTLGIAGCGRIGQRVATIMNKGFGMDIVYYDQNRNEGLEKETGAKFMPKLDDLLAVSDVVSVHLPATPETNHLFNQGRLAKMKSNALLINTARGSVVDEAALAEALKAGVIAGAALDVFENEPDVHPDLLTLSNIVITPHTASATREARDLMSAMAADNIIAALSGQPVLNPVV